MKGLFEWVKEHPWRSVLCLIVVYLCLRSVSIDWSIRNKQKLAETISIGNEICESIQKYKADTGKFPNSLNDLVPKYISTIRSPTAGNGVWYYYVTHGGNEYMVYFTTSFWSEQYYFRESYMKTFEFAS